MKYNKRALFAMHVFCIVIGLSMPLATALAAPIVTPLPPVVSQDPFFGAVQAVYSPDAAVKAAVRWERLVFWWSKMQPNGPDDTLADSWFTDQQINAEIARGITPVGVILSTPAWARRDPAADSISVPRGLELPANDPNNLWANYMGKLAAKYRGRIDTWIIWNEPDMYKGNERRTWSGNVDDYYRLLKMGYIAAKAANPNARIFVSGMTYWWDKENNRRQFMEDLLDRVAADPTARDNGYYFDGLSVHAYANPLNAYAIPQIFRGFLRNRGIDKPIWIQETNVVPRDDIVGQLPAGGFRSTVDEQASFVIQAMALARAAGVERTAIYKMSDTSGEGGEFYGLVRDDGTVRPSYLAFQTAATHFTDVRRAQYSWGGADNPTPDQIAALLRSNEGRFQFVWPSALNKVVLERSSSRVTVVWNASPVKITAQIPVSGTNPRLIDKLGAVQTVSATGGFFSIGLDPATNNSDTRDPSLYLVGGNPMILIEDMTAGASRTPIPTATPIVVTPPINVPIPVPTAATSVIDARIEVVWPHGNVAVSAASRANVTAYLFQTGTLAPVACAFSAPVKLWQAINAAPAQVVATGVRRTELVDGKTFAVIDFNNIDVSAARDPRSKIYFFVTVDGVNARSTIWTHGTDARTFFPSADVPTSIGPITQADAKIEILWPHGNASVRNAKQANLTAMVFQRGLLQTGGATYAPSVRLYRSINSEPGEVVATGVRRRLTAGTLTYPVWDFNDVDVSPANNPTTKIYFWLTVDGVETQTNVWAHGIDARTIFPKKDVPTASCV